MNYRIEIMNADFKKHGDEIDDKNAQIYNLKFEVEKLTQMNQKLQTENRYSMPNLNDR